MVVRLIYRCVMLPPTIALVSCVFSQLDLARADTCPDIVRWLSENDLCNPNGAKTKECDAKYNAPSIRWRACYEAVSNCRDQVFRRNKEITSENSAISKCRASVASQLVQRQGHAVAHSPGTVSPIRQPTSMSCWATAAAMMYSWKHNQSTSIQEVLGRLGPSYKSKFELNEGLSGEEKSAFLAAMGLTAEIPQNLDARGWASLIKKYGPLWITTNEGTGARFSIHARIISGVFGDGSSEGTTFVIVDPADGKVHLEAMRSFVKKFEDVARIDLGDTGELRPQIVHY